MVLFPEPALLRAETPAVEPKLTVTLGALVEISVVETVPPMLPVRLVRVTLPVALVVMVFADDPFMLPADVCKETDCMVAFPRTPDSVIAFAPWSFTDRLVAARLTPTV